MLPCVETRGQPPLPPDKPNSKNTMSRETNGTVRQAIERLVESHSDEIGIYIIERAAEKLKEIKNQKRTRRAIEREMNHLERIWDRMPEWEAEERHDELMSLLHNEQTCTNHYPEYRK